MTGMLAGAAAVLTHLLRPAHAASERSCHRSTPPGWDDHHEAHYTPRHARTGHYRKTVADERMLAKAAAKRARKAQRLVDQAGRSQAGRLAS